MQTRDLPQRLYRHGLSFRYHAPDGTRFNLGRDLDAALTKYQIITAPPPAFDVRSRSAAERMWRRHAKGAKARGINFAISVEDVVDALARQKYLCAVTSLTFNDEKPKGVRIRPWLPSIDRTDASEGYEPGNIRVVCAFVNIAMNGFGDSFFLAVLKPLVDAEVKARLASYSHVGISGSY